MSERSARDPRPPLDMLAALALALPLEKLVLLIALARGHGERLELAGAAAALAAECGAAAILLLAGTLLRRGSGARNALVALAALLVVATWLAVAPWGFAGTVVPLGLTWSLLTSPAILATATSQRELLLPLLGWLLGLVAILLLALLIAQLLRRRTGSRGLVAVAGLATLACVAAGSLSAGSNALARPALVAALLGATGPEGGGAGVDAAATRELSGPREPHTVASSPARNVLIVVLESVRWEPDSPFVRGFPEALHFDRVYAHQARSVKTLEALLFGIYPSLARETAVWAIDQYDAGPDATLPRLLRTHGFATSYLGAMDLRFENYMRALEASGVERIERVAGDRTLTWGVPARTVFARAAELLDPAHAHGTRQLVVAWTTECHRPYDTAAAAGTTGTDRERYRACQHALADALRTLLADLAGSGALRDTLVIAFGDHGQLFPEDRGDDPVYGQNVHERALRVPLLVWPPAEPTPPRRSADDRLFQLVDVPATVAAASGIAPPGDWVGRNLLDPAEPGRDFVVLASLLDADVLGVVEASGRKVAASMRDGAVVAYDLDTDPDERNGVAQDGAARTRDLARLQTYRAIAARGWDRRVDASTAHEETFRGATLARFGRVGVCLRVTPDADGRALRYAPSDLPRCRRRTLRRREIVRPLQVDLLAGASALRVELELRLDGPAAAGGAPQLRARLGDRGNGVARPLATEVGAWQTVAVTLPVPGDLRERLRADAPGTIDLGITPVDEALPFSLAAIRVEPIAE